MLLETKNFFHNNFYFILIEFCFCPHKTKDMPYSSLSFQSLLHNYLTKSFLGSYNSFYFGFILKITVFTNFFFGRFFFRYFFIKKKIYLIWVY